MNKDLNLLCMSCFSPLPSVGAACPVCGYIEGVSADQSPHQLPIRTILAGKYLIGRVLGEGGFGITYVGYDLNLDIKVAVKEYFPSGFATRTSTVSETVSPHSGDKDGIFIAGRERFVGEAKRLAHFRTLPGIVMVSDFFAENGTAYIVMEYVEGQTLKEYLAQQGGTLPAEQVVNMLAPVFASLAQVHGSGIIHRDISPDNIMITAEGMVKLLDFGAAREFEDSGNKSLSVLLKHGYAPTEQYSSKGKQGPHTDVYALAATIYRAITGVTPENAMDRILDDTMQPPRAHGVAITPQQESALMKALAVRAEHRFQTVSEFYGALTGNGELRIESGELGRNIAPIAPPQPVQSVGDAPLCVPQNVETPPQTPESPQGIATSPAEPRQSASLRSRARNDADDAKPKSKRKAPIIAAIVGAVVLIAVVFALTRPGGTQDEASGIAESPTTTPSADVNASPENTNAETPAAESMVEEDPKQPADQSRVEIDYDSDGWRYEHEVDANGNLVKKSVFDDTGVLFYRTEREYDASGNQTKETRYDSDGAISWWREYEYDTSGNVTKNTSYDSDGAIRQWYEHEYDAYGNQTKYTGYDSDRMNSWWYEYEYDAYGNQTKETSYDSDGTTLRWREFEHDARGNETKRTGYDSEGTISWRTEFEYDSRGNETKRTGYDSEGTILWRYEYEYDASRNQTKYTEYNSVGSIRWWQEYEYDAHGNEIMAIGHGGFHFSREIDGIDVAIYTTQSEYSASGEFLLRTVYYGENGEVVDISR